MTRAKRRIRFVLASVGFVLVAFGLLAAYWWHYKLAPMRHLADPDWLATHSETARWKEEQTDYRRMGSSHDLCFRGDRIGYYGGKDWFLWLDERIRNPEFRHCGCTEYALALMANRHATSWKEWADANRARSQEEWIKDGFLDYGVTVHLPPTPDDTLPLLRLLGRKSWNVLWAGPQGTNAPEAVPSYIHYNAYRWLRDSGFDSGKFASSNVTVAAESDITGGLLRFSQWRAAYPGHDGLGVLAFGRAGASGSDFDMRPVIAKLWVVFGVDAFIAACTIGGAVLVLRFTKKKADTKRVEQGAAPNGGPATPPGNSGVTEGPPSVSLYWVVGRSNDAHVANSQEALVCLRCLWTLHFRACRSLLRWEAPPGHIRHLHGHAGYFLARWAATAVRDHEPAALSDHLDDPGAGV